MLEYGFYIDNTKLKEEYEKKKKEKKKLRFFDWCIKRSTIIHEHSYSMIQSKLPLGI